MTVPAHRLQALPLFSTLSEEEREAVGRLFEVRRVSPGTRLTLEGASGYSFFVIEEGTVEVERAGRLLETLGPGDFFGEAAILTGERRNASVTAASDATLFVLFGTEFRILERDYPAAAEKIMQKMLERTTEAPQT